MSDSIEPTTVTSLTGALITMVGLLISLFNVQLGNWLSKLQGLRTKWGMNSSRTDEKERQARRECRYTLAEIFNWQPAVMTTIIVLFAAGVVFFFNDFRLSAGVAFPSIFVYLYNGFFAIMMGLQIFLVISGYVVGYRLKREIDQATETAKARGGVPQESEH